MNKKVIVLILMFAVLISAKTKNKPKVIKKEVKESMKIAMIVAKNNFRDEEYLHPKEIFVKSNFEVETFSSSTGTAKGMLGATIKIDRKIDELKVDNFDAIIFVGGTGSTEYWDSELAHKIVNEAVKQNKILAAICIAPVTLAKAGVLKGKKATVFSSEIEQLKSYGANYTEKDVEVDGKIVTASGPHAAKEFGEKIKELLLKNK